MGSHKTHEADAGYMSYCPIIQPDQKESFERIAENLYATSLSHLGDKFRNPIGAGDFGSRIFGLENPTDYSRIKRYV